MKRLISDISRAQTTMFRPLDIGLRHRLNYYKHTAILLLLTG
jgi:hypothetical protein